MNRPVPEELLAAFRDASFFCVIGHAEPDGDCIGAQLALGSFLRRIGKEVLLLSPGPFERPEIKPFEREFAGALDPSARARRPTVVVLDCSSPERIGDLAGQIAGLPLLVVDHHSSGKSFGDLAFIDDSAPSVTLLVLHVIERLGYAPEPEEARLMLFGLCTDTGFFRHLDAREPSVYEAIARLNAAGATPKAIHRMIFSGRPLASRLLLGRLLARTEPLFEGRLLFTYETLADKQEFGAEQRDSDTLYQLLQGTAGCEAVILIREEDEASCTVGLRSNATVDVGAVAQAFGGGGHRRAAGFRCTGDLLTTKAKLLGALEPLLALPT